MKRLLSLLIVMLAITIPNKLWAQGTKAEPYAVLSENNTVLTFYYDDQKDVRNGMSVVTFYSQYPRGWNDNATMISKVVFDETFANYMPTNTTYWFYQCTNLKDISGIENLNTANVIDMRYMFYGCSSLTSLDLSSFNTINVTSMGHMFHGCSGLTNIDVSSFNTTNVTDLGEMFYGCKNLMNLDVSRFNTANVTYISSMFRGCSEIVSLDLGSFNTASVMYMASLFANCSNLTTIYVGNAWSTATVTEGADMFKNCTNLVGGAGSTYDANHTDYTYAHIDGGPDNPGYFTRSGDEPYTVIESYAVLTGDTISGMTLTFYCDTEMNTHHDGTVSLLNDLATNETFTQSRPHIKKAVFAPSFAACRPSSTAWFYDCTNLSVIEGMEYLNTSETVDMGGMFSNCSSLVSLDVSHFDTSNVTNMEGMFWGCSSLTNLDLSNFNTANVGSMRGMFAECSSLTNLNVGSFNTSSAIDISWMFGNIPSLTSLDVAGFNTENVTDMAGLFYGCNSLNGIDVSHFNTSKVTNMENMFGECHSLTSIDVSNFNTANVTNMNFMFGRTALADIDVSGFNTENVEIMRWMFAGMRNLVRLNLANFNTSKVTDMRGMFASCGRLNTVYVGDNWNTEAVVLGDSLFVDSWYMQGGAGTWYSSERVGLSVAHIDGGESNPGYLTSANGLRNINVYVDAENAPDLYSWDIKGDVFSATLSERTVIDGRDFWKARLFSTNPIHILFGDWSITTNNYSNQTNDILYLLTDRYYTYDGANGYIDISEKYVDVPLVDIEKLTLAGNFNGWSYTANEFTEIERNKTYSIDIDVTDFVGDTLSIIPIANGCAYIVNHLLKVEASDFLINHRSDVMINLKATSARRFNIVVNWEQSKQFEKGWSMIITELFEPEPYAVLSDNNTVLTFYYDGQKVARNGLDINYTNSWDDQRKNITKAVFDDSFANCLTLTRAHWLGGCSKLTTIIGIENLKTDNVTDMSGMFYDCSSLTSLDVSHFKTDNVTTMGVMFMGCSSLSSLDVSHFNTEKMTNMNAMFYGCSNLSSLDLSSFKTDNVTDMSSMFSDCSGLTSLDVSKFNTENVTNMSFMFNGCSKLTNLDVGGFKTDNVTSMNSMFKGCSNLTSLDVSGFKTDNVTSMTRMFNGCKNLTSLDVSHFNTANVTDMYYMFHGCSGLTSLDVSHFNTSNVTDMGGMFQSCSSLTSLDMSGFNTNKVTRMSAMFDGSSGLTTIYAGNGWTTNAVTSGPSVFYGCTNLVGGKGTTYDANHTDYTYAHIDGGPNNPGYFTYKNAPVIVETEPYAVLSENNTVLTFYYDDQKAARNGMSVGPFDGNPDYQAWYDQRESITSVVFDASFDNCTTITSTAYWFYGCEKLTTITGISNLKTGNVTDMGCMFEGCSNLTSLDVSHFDTSLVEGMYFMFAKCSKLTNLDLSNFNTSNVKKMHYMFWDCSALQSIALSNFNTSNVIWMHCMFDGCFNLTSLDVSNFDTSNVTEIEDMFDRCYSLTSLDVSHFNTSKAKYLSAMFNDCRKLKSIDVSHFDTSNAESMLQMFAGCYSLTSLDVSNFNTAKVTNMKKMFSGCSNLVDINMSNFNTDNVTDMTDIFANCTSLASIQAGSAMIPASEYAKVENPNLLVYVNNEQYAPENIQNVVIGDFAKNIVLTDVSEGNGNFYCPQEFKAEKITYSHDYGQTTEIGVARGWETIALPFTVQTVTHADKGAIAPFGVETSNKHFWLRQLTQQGLARATQIEANMPYLISMPNSDEYTADYNLNGEVTFSAQNAVVPMTEPIVTNYSDAGIEMVPALQRVDKSSDVWALNVGVTRDKYFEGSTFERDYRMVRPFEAYTVHHGNIEGLAPRFVPIADMSNGATNIEKVANSQQPIVNGMYYDLNGRKLQQKPKQKGVYLHNGHKVIVR